MCSSLQTYGQCRMLITSSNLVGLMESSLQYVCHRFNVFKHAMHLHSKLRLHQIALVLLETIVPVHKRCT